LQDYYERLAYDRCWIYRSHQDDIIVDVIWGMPNRRATVDRQWLDRAKVVELRGMHLKTLPVEELIWAKLYVMQRDRCDWPDIFNLLYHVGDEIDWDHLLRRLENDAPLLGCALGVFAWLCPRRAERFPEWIWARVGRQENGEAPVSRADLLDTRPWFGPRVPA
jgi:hypothetical protein